MEPPSSLAGRPALVTGGARGIGAAIAAALESNGARVVVADRDEAPIRCDLGRPGEATRMVTEAVKRLGGLHILVNNAGGYASPTYPQNANWRTPLELNLGAVMEATRHALPALAANGGCVVNVASSAGLGGDPYAGVEYAVAKAGVIRLTTALGRVDGVRVNCVCPHTVATEGVLTALETASIEDIAPPPPTLIRVEDVVDAALRLIGDESLAGKVLVLVGGEGAALPRPIPADGSRGRGGAPSGATKSCPSVADRVARRGRGGRRPGGSPIQFGVTILPDPPCSRFVELVRLAEDCGFDWAYTYDSHILWQEGCVLVTAAAVQTQAIGLGFCVTNPGTREPTVTASFHATLNTIIPGRVVVMIGRGDSARRTIGLQPVKIAEFEAATALIRDMSNGRAVTWNGKDIVLEWARDLPRIPIWVAGYGPRALGVAGRQADGVVIQLADPDIIDWIMGQARGAAEKDGRAPGDLAPIVCAPVAIGDDMAVARDAVRWFPAMVSNHVVDLLKRYDQSMLPESLTSYLARREFYDYADHSREGAKHGEFVDDETCDRFCILGSIEEHIAKLRTLEAQGVAQFNIYLMTGHQEEILRAYGEHIIPLFKRTA